MKNPERSLPSRRRAALWAVAVLTVGSGVAGGLRGQAPKGEPAVVRLPYPNAVRIQEAGGYRTIASNGIPEHLVGRFPGRGNPNTVSPQSYELRVPVEPQPAARPARSALFGVAVNGVVFDPTTAEFWNGDRRWTYEALSGRLGGRNALGVDANLAHVQPNGAYHYHGPPTGLLERLDYKHRMALVGWAADGYPIYGAYVHAKADDPSSPLEPVRSSYRLKSGDRPSGDGPGGAYDGSFASDYEYVKGSGDLDEYNGRTGVTPEFPKGTFYYVLTPDWPYVPRILKGQPDPSFSKGQGGPPGGGGPRGGPGGPQRGRGMVPGDALADYLEITPAQRARYGEFKRALEALGAEGFAMGEYARLGLAREQVRRLGGGEGVRSVLTPAQVETLDRFRRREDGPGGGPP